MLSLSRLCLRSCLTNASHWHLPRRCDMHRSFLQKCRMVVLSWSSLHRMLLPRHRYSVAPSLLLRLGSTFLSNAERVVPSLAKTERSQLPCCCWQVVPASTSTVSRPCQFILSRSHLPQKQSDSCAFLITGCSSHLPRHPSSVAPAYHATSVVPSSPL